MTGLGDGNVERAPAKINLALHVRERLADGYHRIETLFAFAEDGDALRYADADTLSLVIEGAFADGLPVDDSNLVLRAARALAAAYNRPPRGALTLTKNLPVASGVGGGSADAAAALRLLQRAWRLDTDDGRLHAIAAILGADVPACLLSQTALGTGVGEILESVDCAGLTGTPLLLANPGVPCPTGAVFKGWDGVDRGSLDIEEWRSARNDLAKPAICLVPEIAVLLDVMADQPGANLVRMSGSGATCFALFDDFAARDAADAALRSAVPGVWTLASHVR